MAVMLARPAGADELPFVQAPAHASFQSATWLESHDDRDAYEGNEPRRGIEAIGRMDLRLTSADWMLTTVGTGFGRLTARDDPAREDVVDLEEASLAGPVTSSLRVLAGDHRPRFGRGLVLDFTSGGGGCHGGGSPMSLRGGRVDLDAGPTKLTALGGLVHLPPLDPATELVLEEREDAIGGARVEVHPSARTTFSLSYAAATLEPPEGSSSAGEQIAGFAAELDPPGAGLGLYAEAAYSTLTVDARPQPGTAIYLAADYTVGPVTIMLEGKDYNRFKFTTIAPTFIPPEGAVPPAGGWPMAPVLRYNAPPTLERMGELLPADENTLGGRGTLTLRVSREVTVDVAYVKQFYFHARGDEPRAGENGYFSRGLEGQHVYGELRLNLRSGVDMSAGGGVSGNVEVESGNQHAYARHADARAEIPIYRGWSAAGVGEWRERLYVGDQATIGAVGLSVRSPHGISVGGRYEYTDEFKDWDQDDQVVPRRHFFSLDGKVPFGPHEAFAVIGSTAGGLRCLDGACRIVPPFHGFRVGARLRF
ncbi:MAG: hypothetical protein HYY06_01885 [Deltaproteobacteria bacterium]|nr:hypothetical protein [Deltaproteobacteria bacterium]